MREGLQTSVMKVGIVRKQGKGLYDMTDIELAARELVLLSGIDHLSQITFQSFM